MILEYKDGDGTVKRVRLKQIAHSKPITIGRGAEASVVLNDSTCSRVHTAIRYWDDVFVVRDMNSRNGTFVNGQQVEIAILHPGDVVKIGAIELTALSDVGSRSDVTEIIRFKENE